MDLDFNTTFVDFKHKQVLELCNQCILKMVHAIEGRVGEHTEVYQSLQFLKMEIGVMGKREGIPLEDVQSIIRRIFDLKDMIENTPETSSCSLEFLPFVEGLLMFLY